MRAPELARARDHSIRARSVAKIRRTPSMLQWALILVAVLLGCGGQRYVAHESSATDGDIQPAERRDRIDRVLAEHQDGIAAAYARTGQVVPQFGVWLRVDSPAARQLFPDLVFAMLTWNETPDPRAEGKVVGLAFGLQVTLGIDPDAGRVVAELHGSGNYEAFGRLLVERGIRLVDAMDAELIWAAFCELHEKSWKGQPHRRVGENEWRLGLYSYEQSIASDGEYQTVVTRTHSMHVFTDPATQRVTEWTSIVETADERRVPMEPRG